MADVLIMPVMVIFETKNNKKIKKLNIEKYGTTKIFRRLQTGVQKAEAENCRPTKK
jgi:hypothetical protein